MCSFVVSVAAELVGETVVACARLLARLRRSRRVSAAAPRHGPDCECARCRGFQPGNEIGAATRFPEGNEEQLTHGAYAELRLLPLRNEAADMLRRLVPNYDPADEPLIRLAAGALARVELATQWLAERGLFRDDAGELQPVLRALSSWENTASRTLLALGCAPTVRKQLELGSRSGGADGTPAALTAAELHAHARLSAVDEVDGEATETPS